MIPEEIGRFTLTSGSFDTPQFGGKITIELYPQCIEDWQNFVRAIGNGNWRKIYALVHVGDVEPLRPVPQSMPKRKKVDSPSERELTLRALYRSSDET